MIFHNKLLFSSMALIFSTALMGVVNQNPMGGAMVNQGYAQPPYNPMNINEPGSNLQEEQELNNMLNDIEAYRNNLPEQERIKFDKDVNDTAMRMESRMQEMIKNDPTLQEKLDRQDPDAINAIVQNIFQPEFERAEAEAVQQPQEVPTEAIPAEETPIVPETHEEKPAKQKVKKVDIKSALELIGSIVEYLESFKEKTNTIIKFPGYYEKWAKEGRLRGWTKDLTWQKFSEKLELLVDRFKELERRDPETKEYTHLGDLIEDESLYQDLTQFNDDLSENEPRISVPETGIGDMNSAAKDAARQTLNICLYGITKLQDKITTLISKYEKTAKKISEEKEKARQKAEQATKQRRPGYTLPIGSTQEGYPYYPEQVVGPYTPYTPWETPSAQPEKITPPEIEKPEKKKDEGKKEGDKGGKKEEKKKSEEEQAADHALVELMDKVADISYSIDDNENLKKFGEYMTNAREDYDPAAAAALKQIQTQLKEAAKTVRRTGAAWFPRLDPSAKNSYIKQFSDMLDKDEQSAPLRKLISDIESIEKSRSGVSKRKQFGFFDDQTRKALKDAAQQEQEQKEAARQKAAAQRPQAAQQPQAPAKGPYDDIAETASIFTLPNDYKKLKEAVESLKNVKPRPGQKKQASEQRVNIPSAPPLHAEEAAE